MKHSLAFWKFCLALQSQNRKAQPGRRTTRSYARRNVKDLEIITDNLSKAGWSRGCVSALDSKGRTIWIVDAHRDDGKRFVVRADEKLTAFLELERVTRERANHWLERLVCAARCCFLLAEQRPKRERQLLGVG